MYILHKMFTKMFVVDCNEQRIKRKIASFVTGVQQNKTRSTGSSAFLGHLFCKSNMMYFTSTRFSIRKEFVTSITFTLLFVTIDDQTLVSAATFIHTAGIMCCEGKNRGYEEQRTAIWSMRQFFLQRAKQFLIQSHALAVWKVDAHILYLRHDLHFILIGLHFFILRTLE